MFSDKFHPFVPHNWIGRKLMHSYARSVARIRTTLFVRGASDAILPPLRTFSLDAILQSRILSTTLRHQATWPDSLAARFEYHFWEQNRTTFGHYKIANFLQTRFKLWNRVFETLNFQNIKTLISLHMHFKQKRSKVGAQNRFLFLRRLARRTKSWKNYTKTRDQS